MVLVGAEGVVESGGIVNKVSDDVTRARERKAKSNDVVVFIDWQLHDGSLCEGVEQTVLCCC